jgi:hypothetical protein
MTPLSTLQNGEVYSPMIKRMILAPIKRGVPKLPRFKDRGYESCDENKYNIACAPFKHKRGHFVEKIDLLRPLDEQLIYSLTGSSNESDSEDLNMNLK